MIRELPPEVAEIWPFEPQWCEVDGYALHHVDEGPDDGSGNAVVLLHGNPTWGFLYRDIIPKVVDAGFRVVVPDFLGFGRSDHARAGEDDLHGAYAIPEHSRRLLAQLDAAGVRRAAFFLQDWGGPIGFGTALERPEMLAGLALANTFWGAASQFQHNALGWRALHAPVSGALLLGKRRMFVNALKLSGPRSIHDGAAWAAYSLPFQHHQGPGGTFAFPRSISTGPGHPTQPLVDRIWDALPHMDVPTRFVWGEADAVFTREEQEAGLRSRLPRAAEHETVVVSGGRHFVQEYGPQECADAVIAVAREAFGG